MVTDHQFYRSSDIPVEYKRNFIHLYFDMAWFGVLSGSAISFLNVYATRLGASGFQLGLIAAVPAVMSLVFSIPAGNWLQTRPVGKAVFWSAALARLGYLLWIPLPWLLGNQGQIWAFILITQAMGIPMCTLGIGFNTLFAEAVPSQMRAYVVGRRNMIQSLTFVVASIGTGYILDRLAFPGGYQLIFGIGFLSAAMSTLHLFFIRPPDVRTAVSEPDPVLPNPSERISSDNWKAILHLEIWKTPFRRVLLVFFAFHFAQYIAFPLFPLITVNKLHFSNAVIGLATAFFYLMVMLGSTQLSRLANKMGHRGITGIGVIGLGFYPIAIALAQSAFHYYILSIMGGLIYAFVIGGYTNYLLERIPQSDRASHLAWYNLVLNAAILLASLSGPLIANFTGLEVALVSFGILRALAGVAILLWG